MDAQEFALLVKTMRQTQKNYFRTRAKSVLQESKVLESRVDAALAQMNLPKTEVEQLRMFG